MSIVVYIFYTQDIIINFILLHNNYYEYIQINKQNNVPEENKGVLY